MWVKKCHCTFLFLKHCKRSYPGSHVKFVSKSNDIEEKVISIQSKGGHKPISVCCSIENDFMIRKILSEMKVCEY